MSSSDSNGQPTVRSGDVLQLEVESLAFGGEGVARAQNGEKTLVVFVEDVVPGDAIEVRIGKKKKNFAIGYLQKITKPSAERITPRCKHFGPATIGCGGCVWQFMDIHKQRMHKEQQVKDAIKRIGGLDENLVRPILGGEPWFYRNKWSLVLVKCLMAH